MHGPQLTVVLLCHNRPQLAVEAIRSILNQTNKNFRFVVSDNSSNDELQIRLKSEFPNIARLSWFPCVPAFYHINNVIRTIETRYFVMFHDDDLMEPAYVQHILDRFERFPSAAAIGTNAYPIDMKGEIKGRELWYHGPRGDKHLTDRRDLLAQYLVNDLGGIAPFSSYAYNLPIIRGIFTDFGAGRDYCDTLFLLEIMKRGPIVWIDKPLTRIRIHEGNQSNFCAVREYKIFIAWVRREFRGQVSTIQIDEYRFPRLFLALARRGRLPSAAFRYFLVAFPRLMIASSSFRMRVVRKLIATVRSVLKLH